MLFWISGIYGLALSLLIFSSLVTPAIVDLFVAQPYTLGTHGADWEYWHGVSCAFVAIVSLLARTWPERAQLGAAAAVAFVYGTWGLQNLYLVLFTERYVALMWLHVALCLGVGIYGAVTALQLRAALRDLGPPTAR